MPRSTSSLADNRWDNLPLDTLVGPALVLNFSDTPPGHELDRADFEHKLGRRRPERILMRFDWSEHWGQMTYYTDHPFISESAAHWLVRQGVRLLGMDTPMPDNPQNGWGSDLDSPVHKILLGNGVILVEYLCNLKQLERSEIDLIVLPLKILGGDGAPARVVAIEP